MYEALTNLLPLLVKDNYGELIIDNQNDGTPNHPINMPYISYSKIIFKLIEEIYHFNDDHPDYNLKSYSEILEENNIDGNAESIRSVDVSALDGKVIMALLMWVVRKERLSTGALLSFCKDGSILKWLERLKEIDG